MEGGDSSDTSGADPASREKQFSSSQIQSAVVAIGKHYNGLEQRVFDMETQLSRIDRLEERVRKLEQGSRSPKQYGRDGDGDGDHRMGGTVALATRNQMSSESQIDLLTGKLEAALKDIHALKAEQSSTRHIVNEHTRSLKIIGSTTNTTSDDLLETKETHYDLAKRIKHCEHKLAELNAMQPHRTEEEVEDCVERLYNDLSEAVGGVDIRKWIMCLASRLIKLEKACSTLSSNKSTLPNTVPSQTQVAIPSPVEPPKTGPRGPPGAVIPSKLQSAQAGAVQSVDICMPDAEGINHSKQPTSVNSCKDVARDSQKKLSDPSKVHTTANSSSKLAKNASNNTANSSKNVPKGVSDIKAGPKPSPSSSPDVLSNPRRSQPIVSMRRPREPSSSPDDPKMPALKSASVPPPKSVSKIQNPFSRFKSQSESVADRASAPVDRQKSSDKGRSTASSKTARHVYRAGKMDIDTKEKEDEDEEDEEEEEDDEEEEEEAETTESSEGDHESSPPPFSTGDIRRAGVSIPGERRSVRLRQPGKPAPSSLSWKQVEQTGRISPLYEDAEEAARIRALFEE